MTRLGLCLLASLFVIAMPASAQTFRTATSEDVAIAFYKLAGLKPSFKSWAQDTQAYHEAPPARRKEVLATEAYRLQKAYEAYSPAMDTLNLATQAIVILVEKPNPKITGGKRYLLSWTFATENGEYFPYEYRGMDFAMVPQKIKDYQEAELSPQEFRTIKEKIQPGVPVRLILQLRAQYADARQPIKIYDQDVWALATMVASASIWDESGALVWEKTASNYKSPLEEDLIEPLGTVKQLP